MPMRCCAPTRDHRRRENGTSTPPANRSQESAAERPDIPAATVAPSRSGQPVLVSVQDHGRALSRLNSVLIGGTLGLAVQAGTAALPASAPAPVRWPDTSHDSERPGRRRSSQRQHRRQPIANGPAGWHGPRLVTMSKALDQGSRVPDPWRRIGKSARKYGTVRPKRQPQNIRQGSERFGYSQANRVSHAS